MVNSSLDPGQSKNRRGALVVMAGLTALTFGVLYSLREAQQVHDSMTYAVSIKTGLRLYHPHHLLFGPIVRALLLPLRSVLDAIEAAQIHNAMWAVAAVLAAFAITRRATGSIAQGAAAGVLLIATYGFLFFGVQVEVYVPAAACFTLVISLLGRERSRAGLAAIAILLALSIFYHQPNVMLCLPLGAYLTCSDGRRGLRTALGLVAAAGALVLGAYVAVYALKDGAASVSGFVEFTMGYAVDADEHARDWGDSGNLSVEGLLAMLTAQMSTIAAMPAGIHVDGRSALGVGMTALTLWSVVSIIRRSKSAGVRGLLLGWWLVNDLFYLWWQPGQREFYVAPLVPIILLAVMALGDLTREPRARLTSGIVLAVLGLGLMVTNVRHIDARMTRMMRPAAEAYLQLVPKDAVHLAFRNSMQELRYSFDIPVDRSFNITIAKHRLTSGIGAKTRLALPNDEQVVVPGSEVIPPRKHSVKRASGWMRYLAWVFRLRLSGTGPDGLGGPVVGPPVRLVSSPGGPFYLVQGPADVSYEDLPAFLRELDIALESGGRRAVFETWFRDHRAHIAHFDNP